MQLTGGESNKEKAREIRAYTQVRPYRDRQAVLQMTQTMRPDTDIPWFGQLMNAPQLLAYLLQINFWLKEYHIAIG